MTENKTMEEIKKVLVEEARTDTVGLWAVLWEVKQKLHWLSAAEAKSATLSVIREALMGGRVAAGEFVDQDEETLAFSRWELPVDDIVTRIDRAWATLGGEPNPGDIVWFVDHDLLPLTARRQPMGKGWMP